MATLAQQMPNTQLIPNWLRAALIALFAFITVGIVAIVWHYESLFFNVLGLSMILLVGIIAWQARERVVQEARLTELMRRLDETVKQSAAPMTFHAVTHTGLDTHTSGINTTIVVPEARASVPPLTAKQQTQATADDALDRALKGSFPASDVPAAVQPTHIGGCESEEDECMKK